MAMYEKFSASAPDERWNAVTAPSSTKLLSDSLLSSSTSLVEPAMIIYEHENFGGEDWHLTGTFPFIGDHWNDRISSIKIFSGIFEFYPAINFGLEDTWGPIRLGAGEYRRVSDVGIFNDSITSFKSFYNPNDTPPPPQPAPGERPASSYAGIDFRIDGTCGRDGQASYQTDKSTLS